MTNGEDIILRAVQKPLPTLRQPLTTIDIVTKQEFKVNPKYYIGN